MQRERRTNMTDVEFKEIFAEFMTISEGIDWGAVKYQEVEGWDSIAHMSLIAEIEDRLGIMLETDDVIDMSSYMKAVEIVGKYGTEISV